MIFGERKVRISVRGKDIFSSQGDVNLQMNCYFRIIKAYPIKPTLLFVAVQKCPDYQNISCLLGMNILMLPTTIQDSDLIYEFTEKQCNNCLSGEGNGQVLSGAKVFEQGFHPTFLVIALSLSVLLRRVVRVVSILSTTNELQYEMRFP